MKTFSALTIALLIIFQAVGFAATETFSASGEYLMSDYDTPTIAEEIALEFAKQNAAEQAGVYLESYSRSLDSELEEDEIKTVASSKVEVLTKNITRQSQSNGRILLRADITASVDTSELDNFLSQQREQRQLAIQRYRELQAMNDKIKQDIDAFQAKLAAIKEEVKDDELQVEQERINREFLSKQKLNAKDFDEAIKINPRNCEAYVKRVERTYETSSPQEAMKDFTRAMILEPSNPTYYDDRAWFRRRKLSDYDGAVVDYYKALKLDPEDYSAVAGFWHIYHMTLGEDERGIEHLTKVIKLYPQNQNAYSYRGWFYEQVKDYPHAIEDFTKALTFKPKDGFNLEMRAECYVKLKDYEHAMKDYERIMEFDLRRGCFRVALLHRFYTKDLAGGIKYFDAMIERYPNDPAPYSCRSELYEEMENYPRAIEDLSKGASLEPKNGYYRKVRYKKLSDLCRKAGDSKNAIMAFEELIELEPEQPTWHIRRGDFYKEANDNGNAIREYITAIKLAPDKKEISRLVGDWLEYRYDKLPTFKRSDFYKSNDKKLIVEAFTELINAEPNNPELYKLRGDFYREVNDFDNAAKDYTYAIKFEPNNPKYYEIRGDFYKEMNDIDNAAKDYIAMTKLATDAWKYHKKVIMLYKDAKDYARAVEYCQQLIKLDVENTYLLIDLYKDMGEQKKVNQLYDDLIKRDPDNATLRELRGTINDYTHLINLKPDNKNFYQKRAELYVQRGDYDKAIADYSKAVEIDPSFMNCYKARAEVYVKKEDYARAIEEYTNLIELDPVDSDYAFVQRARIYEKLGELEKALADYDNAIESEKKYSAKSGGYYYIEGYTSGLEQIIDKLYKQGIVVEPKNLKTREACQKCGFFYKRKGNFDLAERHYTRAIELDPDSLYPYSDRADFYEDRAFFQRDIVYYDKAIADLDKVLEFNPDNKNTQKKRQSILDKIDKVKSKTALLERGNSHQDKKEYDLAIKEYTQALELDSNYQDAYFQRGRTYIIMGKYKEAVEDYNKLIKLNPNYDRAIYYNRGQAYRNLENYDAAIADYTKYLQFNSNDEDTYFCRGMMYIFTNKYEAALADYNKLIALNSNYGSNAYNNRGYAYENLGQYEKALADYDKALELDANNDVAKKNRQRVIDKLKK